MTDEPYELTVAGPATRLIQHVLPEAVAGAVIEFITGPLLDNPQRVGKKLPGDLEGRHAARRSAYRVIYRIDDAQRRVVVLRIEHRVDVYRPR